MYVVLMTGKTKEEITFQPRVAPPSYEEALSSRVVTSLRLGQTGIRSLSEDRATSHPSPPPPFRGRNSSGGNLRPLTRSSRVEEIPDIYWEQAARELDFCTCRKCQVGCLDIITTRCYRLYISTYVFLWYNDKSFVPDIQLWDLDYTQLLNRLL